MILSQTTDILTTLYVAAKQAMENHLALIRYVLTVHLKLAIVKLVPSARQIMLYAQTVLTDFTRQHQHPALPVVLVIHTASYVQTMEPVLNAIVVLVTS